MHVYDYYVIVIIHEGQTVSPKHNQTLINVVDTYFVEKDFVYITHRKNSYSVDPSVYLETAKIKSLKGFAVVSNDYKSKSNAEVEKLFLKKPFEIFDTVDEATSWAKIILNK